jgi:hypothetical protein
MGGGKRGAYGCGLGVFAGRYSLLGGGPYDEFAAGSGVGSLGRLMGMDIYMSCTGTVFTIFGGTRIACFVISAAMTSSRP